MQESSVQNNLRSQVDDAPFSPRLILFGTDFSTACDSAWNYALAIASEYHSKLLLAHVIDPAVFASVPPDMETVATEQIRRERELQLERLQQSDGVSQLDIETLLTEGDVAEVLLRALERRKVDLLIAGTRGYTDTDRLLLGSVAEKLFRQAPCPVLVVPERANFGETLVIRRILCPIDVSADSPTAVAYAGSIARHYGAQLILMHVLDESVAGLIGKRDLIVQDATDRLRELLDRGQSLSSPFEIEVVFGAPAERISRVAVEYQVDLTVLSVHAAGVNAAHEQERTAYRTIRWSP